MAHPTFGLIAAPFTPLHPDRSLNLDAIPHYAQWLQGQGCGSLCLRHNRRGLSLSDGGVNRAMGPVGAA